MNWCYKWPIILLQARLQFGITWGHQIKGTIIINLFWIPAETCYQNPHQCFFIRGKIMKFQVDQLKTFYWIDWEDLPEDKKMNCLWARIMHSYVLEFLSPSMVVIGISIIVITQKIQCMLSKSSPFMLRNSARLQLSVLKFSCRASFHHHPHKHLLHQRPCHGNQENQNHKKSQ